MPSPPPPPSVQAYAPEFARRLGLILAGLLAVAARRALRNPRLLLHIRPLHAWLLGYRARIARLMAAIAAGRAPRSRPPRPTPAHRLRRKPLFPRRFLWLVGELGHEGAACASQLEALCTAPQTLALFAAAPTARRLAHAAGRLAGAPSCAPPPRTRRPRPHRPRPPAPPPIRPTSDRPSALWPWLDPAFPGRRRREAALEQPR